MCGGPAWKREVVPDHKLAYEARKAKKIIASRDISYSFTNVMTHNYYSLRNCVKNTSAEKLTSVIKLGWKRLLLADGPRQSINAINLYGFYLSKLPEGGSVFNLKKYSNNFVTSALIVVSLFTVLVFVLSLILLITAAICYVPLLCYIRGNLKEYCCHKVDKRIAELIKRKTKQRLAKQAALEAKEAAGDYSHLKNKQGQIVGTILPQPTLPTVYLEAEEDVKPQRSKQLTPAPSWPPSEYASTDYASTLHLDYGDYPPPMPEYQPYSHAQPQGQYHGYGQSVATLPQDEGYDKYDDTEYGSTYHLTLNAAPPGEVPQRQRSTSPYANPYSTPAPNPYVQQQQPSYGGGVGRGYDYGTNYY
ncbi:hypothetical protein Clacol_001462 [Clathrus columnatus]|uniref:Uncharacterized protein n=1 Tax=Clathrus columnatus TaxID=1419009 RepID=A0AAV4ZYB4_9AGAM|nr:hypothetical protein Clacol_001462 [Clathrus columnatus]